MNSTALQAKLSHKDGRVRQLAESTRPPVEIVQELYLATLSRLPTVPEQELALTAFAIPATRQTAAEDVLWALLNSAEFVLNH